MQAKKFCRLWEEDGKYYLSDEYDLNRIVFKSAEERQQWMESYEAKLGEILSNVGGPVTNRSTEALKKELERLDSLKQE